jgi:hypothetical protein
MLASGQLTKTGEIEEAVGHRPAELYRFTKRSAVSLRSRSTIASCRFTSKVDRRTSRT